MPLMSHSSAPTTRLGGFGLNHLPSFAMCRAFPGSDYYEGSVAIGVSPRRQSRVGLLVL